MLDPEHERWLTYVEAGELFGISPAAARMLARRRGWPRRTPNMHGDRARVLVPKDADVQPRAASYAERAGNVIAHEQEGPNGLDQPNVRALEQAITALQEQLAIANERAAHAEQRVDVERARVDELQAALAAERQRLIAMLVDRVPWWRRWFR